MLENLGLRRIVVVPRTLIKIDSIRAARRTLLECWFDETRCAAGIAHLEAYRKRWSEPLAQFLDEPVHDIHSEAADAFQQIATGWTPDVRFDLGQVQRVNAAQINPLVRRH